MLISFVLYCIFKIIHFKITYIFTKLFLSSIKKNIICTDDDNSPLSGHYITLCNEIANLIEWMLCKIVIFVLQAP